MVEIRIAVTDEEKQAVYRSRASAPRGTGDGRRRAIVDAEDENSWLIYAKDPGGEVVASYRVTRGSDGFSLRQIARYDLEPFLVELAPRVLAVVERLVIAPAWRRRDLASALLRGARQIPGWDGVLVVCGACPSALLSRHVPSARIYRTARTDRVEDGLVPIVAFPHGPEVLTGLGHGPGLPACVEPLLRDAEPA